MPDLVCTGLGCPVVCGSAASEGPPDYCGDTACNGDETPQTCPQDCSICGNGECDQREQQDGNCPKDCGASSSSSAPFGSSAPSSPPSSIPSSSSSLAPSSASSFSFSSFSSISFSSSMRSSAPSSTYACSGSECVQAGTAYCDAVEPPGMNLICRTTTDLPCYQCIVSSTSSSNNSSQVSSSSSRSLSSSSFSFSSEPQSSSSSRSSSPTSSFGFTSSSSSSSSSRSSSSSSRSSSSFSSVAPQSSSAPPSSSIFRCTDDTTCPLGYRCISGICIPAASSSIRSSSTSRSSSRISSFGGTVNGATGVNGGIGTNGGTGVSYSSTPYCTQNEHCSSGLVCFGGQCVPCTSGTQCAMGQICVQGLCRNPPPASSTSYVPSCTANAQCPTNLCLNGSCLHCPNNSFCASGHCVNGVCSACIQDSECGGERVCQNGQCIVRPQIALLFCGNGLLDSNELCDLGIQNSNAPGSICRTDCSPARCGDSILDAPLEVCDDGNTVNSDGCSDRCQPERFAPGQENIPTYNGNGNSNSGNPFAELPFTASILPTPPTTAGTGPGTILLMAAGASLGYMLTGKRKGR